MQQGFGVVLAGCDMLRKCLGDWGPAAALLNQGVVSVYCT